MHLDEISTCTDQFAVSCPLLIFIYAEVIFELNSHNFPRPLLMEQIKYWPVCYLSAGLYVCMYVCTVNVCSCPCSLTQRSLFLCKQLHTCTVCEFLLAKFFRAVLQTNNRDSIT